LQRWREKVTSVTDEREREINVQRGASNLEYVHRPNIGITGKNKRRSRKREGREGISGEKAVRVGGGPLKEMGEGRTGKEKMWERGLGKMHASRRVKIARRVKRKSQENCERSTLEPKGGGNFNPSAPIPLRKVPSLEKEKKCGEIESRSKKSLTLLGLRHPLTRKEGFATTRGNPSECQL